VDASKPDPQASRVPLPLPPRKGESGTLPAGTARETGSAVEVLEIIDDDNAIVRAWYLPKRVPSADRTQADEATFVDLWLQGIDTKSLEPGQPASFGRVFRVAGNKSFGTTCGSRSVPHLEAIDD
jgi:hypothetical protein